MKTNAIQNLDFFRRESTGLDALRSLDKIKIPRVLGTGTDKQRMISFLALEYVESAEKIRSYWENFGHALAQLHREECRVFVCAEERKKEGDSRKGSWKYGFSEDNYIGSSPQINNPKESWIDFYREYRLLPQLIRAEQYLETPIRKKADWLLEHLDSYLREPEFPSLIHGDLWGGNVLCGSDGKAWLIDPAAYVGDFEAELAMMQLFGGFPAEFYGAYNEVNPVDREYKERKDLYNLYHLLNHLNLFGRAYLGSVENLICTYAPEHPSFVRRERDALL